MSRSDRSWLSPSAVVNVEFFVDPSCPWAWITSHWVNDVAPARGPEVSWRSFCLEIRDDYDGAPTVPAAYRQRALEGHAVCHQLLRIFEAARAQGGEGAVDKLYAEWGRRHFVMAQTANPALFVDCLAAAELDAGLLAASEDESWDGPIRESMAVAYTFGGEKTQTPTIVVRSEPPHGFKGPVMAPAPTGRAALEVWDAV